MPTESLTLEVPTHLDRADRPLFGRTTRELLVLTGGLFFHFHFFISNSQDSITEGATQAVKDRCAQQERLHVCGLLMQDFFDQVIHDELVAAGERLDEAGGVGMAAQGQRG